MSHSKEQSVLNHMHKAWVMGLAFGLYGFSILAAEWLPPLVFGPFELALEYAFFLPLILCIFFHPFFAATGAALAELVVGSLVLSQFEGWLLIGRVVALWAALWVGSAMVKEPRNRTQVAVAGFIVVIVFQSMSTMMNLAILAAAAENLQGVPGLVQLLIIMEGFLFFEAVLVSGFFYTILPSVLLAPYIYRKFRGSNESSSVRVSMLKSAR